MQVSVIVCKRSRADSLRRTLDSATRMHVPEGLVREFVVVDNGAKDHTAQVVAEFEGWRPANKGWLARIFAAREFGPTKYPMSHEDEVPLIPECRSRRCG